MKAHLENELAVAAVFLHHSGNRAAIAPHRSSGLIAQLRSQPDAGAAIECATNGDAGPLAGYLSALPLRSLPAQLVHLLGIYWDAVADAATRAPVSAAARFEALLCWHQFASNASYSVQIARDVLGDAARVDPALAIENFVVARWEALGFAAKAGARELSQGAQAAMAVLAQVELIARRAGLSGPLLDRVLGVVLRAQIDAEEEALAPVREKLRSAQSQNDAGPRRLEVLMSVFAIWAWAGGDSLWLQPRGAHAGEANAHNVARVQAGSLTVEVFALTEALGIGRDLRVKEQRAALAELARLLLPMVDMLAKRVQSGEGFAHAGLTAEAYEMCAVADAPSDNVRLCERALKVCPGHPRAASSLAYHLVDQANLLMQAGALANDARARLSACLQRAHEVEPDSKRLARAVARAATLGLVLELTANSGR